MGSSSNKAEGGQRINPHGSLPHSFHQNDLILLNMRTFGLFQKLHFFLFITFWTKFTSNHLFHTNDVSFSNKCQSSYYTETP